MRMPVENDDDCSSDLYSRVFDEQECCSRLDYRSANINSDSPIGLQISSLGTAGRKVSRTRAPRPQPTTAANECCVSVLNKQHYLHAYMEDFNSVFETEAENHQ